MYHLISYTIAPGPSAELHPRAPEPPRSCLTHTHPRLTLSLSLAASLRYRSIGTLPTPTTTALFALPLRRRSPPPFREIGSQTTSRSKRCKNQTPLPASAGVGVILSHLTSPPFPSLPFTSHHGAAHPSLSLSRSTCIRPLHAPRLASSLSPHHPPFPSQSDSPPPTLAPNKAQTQAWKYT